jgi:hypothetical protein
MQQDTGEMTHPFRRIAWAGLSTLLLLCACAENQYGPPPANGKPENWGQQHYLDNQNYQQQTQDRMNVPD